MLYVLYGKDTFSLQTEVENIKKGLGDPNMLALNTCVLDAEDLSYDKLINICKTTPFLHSSRLVIVQGLLELFEPEKRGKTNKTEVNTNTKSTFVQWKSLADLVKEIPDNTVLMFIDENITLKNPLLKVISPFAKIMTFKLLQGKALNDWVAKKAMKNGNTIEPEAVRLLVELAGNDLWVLHNEINKLSNYCGGRAILTDDIKQITSYAKETNIFDLVDAICENKVKEAQKLINSLTDEGASPIYILAMILRQLRLIIKAKQLGNNVSNFDAFNKLNISSEWVLNKTLKQARRYSYEQLKAVFQKILDADINIKTGKFDGELAINILIVELCQS